MENLTTIDYSRNKLNQYYSVDGVSYSYNINGNLTYDGNYYYYYDCENRLTDVNDLSDDPVASYEYDFKGRRTQKTVSGSTTKYCYDGDQVIAEYDGNDNLLRKYVYGPGIDEPVCMIEIDGQSEIIYYYHFNGTGSVAGISDSSGNLVEKYEYDVFGEFRIYEPNDTLISDSQIGNPYYFTGRRFDTETNNYYYRARYYNPAIGRFLQTDPIGYTDSLNLYQYCLNNPVMYVDPMGLFRFGRRDLSDSLPYSQYYILSGPIPDMLNVGYYHEAGFYQDGSGNYASFGTLGAESYNDGYHLSSFVYDDNIMRQAQKNVDATGVFIDENYFMFRILRFRNCQDYCSALRKEYKKLGGKVKFRLFDKKQGMDKQSIEKK